MGTCMIAGYLYDRYLYNDEPKSRKHLLAVGLRQYLNVLYVRKTYSYHHTRLRNDAQHTISKTPKVYNINKVQCKQWQIGELYRSRAV